MDDDKIIENNEGENPLNEETTSNNGNMADTESDEEVFADAEMTDEDEADEVLCSNRQIRCLGCQAPIRNV